MSEGAVLLLINARGPLGKEKEDETWQEYLF